MTSRLLYLSFVLLLCLNGFSQQVNYRFRFMGLPEAFKNQYMTFVDEDAAGMLWFATNNGLYRFDGKQVLTFDMQSTPALPDIYIRHLLADTRSNVWVATGKGLIRFDLKSWTMQRMQPQPGQAITSLDQVITTIAEGKNGTIYAGSITRQASSSVYSYESERFSVSSNCGDDLNKTVAVSAYFTAPCSGISTAQPADGWVVTSNNNNQIFVKPADYILGTNTSVELQYATNNSNNWTSAATLTSTQLTNGFNFDVPTLPDGSVSFRFRLNCPSGITYSQRATGLIDRKAPQLFGNADPTDDNFVAGDFIGFTYNENLSTAPANLSVTVRRLSNNTLIPATTSIYNNKIIIIPNSPITSFTGDSVRVIVSGISDVYGNVKPKPDTTRFTIGTTVPATGNRALFVTISNPSVYKNNDTGTIKVIFTLPAAATNDTRVNYTIGGTARYNVDYTASYTGSDALYASFTGSTGSIKIPTGSTTATLMLRPVAGDTSYSPTPKTIVISASDGGDYALGTPTSVTGYLTSEDGISTYTFNGDGAWNIRNNWLNGKMPLTTLVAPKEIIIDPAGTCILNVPQTIRTGAKITVKANRRFLIQGNLKLN